jgi:hypothetical protein
LPIPAFFFESYWEDGEEKSDVVDGQQRLNTLRDFHNNTFELVAKETVSYMSPNCDDYAGKDFAHLPHVYQQAFMKYNIVIINLRDLKDMRYEVFRRINQGGVPLSGQDIRLAYHGRESPSVFFIRLVGVYDKDREAAGAFLKTARRDFGVEYPWDDEDAYHTWHDMWSGKDIARGQAASEMFLWSLVTAQHDEMDDILNNEDALSKLKIRFNRGIDDVLDIYCAQVQWQDNNNVTAPALMSFEKMRDAYFPHFQAFTYCLWQNGPRLNIQKHRTAATVIGAAYREGISPEKITKKHKWGEVVEFIRHASDLDGFCKKKYHVDWPVSKGRWDGHTGYHVQMDAACRIIKKIVP